MCIGKRLAWHPDTFQNKIVPQCWMMLQCVSADAAVGALSGVKDNSSGRKSHLWQRQLWRRLATGGLGGCWAVGKSGSCLLSDGLAAFVADHFRKSVHQRECLGGGQTVGTILRLDQYANEFAIVAQQGCGATATDRGTTSSEWMKINPRSNAFTLSFYTHTHTPHTHTHTHTHTHDINCDIFGCALFSIA